MSSIELVRILQQTVWKEKTNVAICKETGITEADMSRIVKGKNNIGILNLTRIEAAYKESGVVKEAIAEYKATALRIPSLA